MVAMCCPLSRSKAIGTNEWWLVQMIYGDPVAFDLLRMQHAGFPSCLRFSFTRNKLEKSRKPSSPARACLSPSRKQLWQHLSQRLAWFKLPCEIFERISKTLAGLR